MKRAAYNSLVILIMGYTVICIGMYVFQRSLLYFPQPRIANVRMPYWLVQTGVSWLAENAIQQQSVEVDGLYEYFVLVKKMRSCSSDFWRNMRLPASRNRSILGGEGR